MGCWLGSPVQRSDRSSLRHNHAGVSPFLCSAASSNPCVWIRGLSNSGLDNNPLDDMIPPLAQFYLLGRGPGTLGFQSSRVACGGALSVTIGHLLWKSRLRFFPIHTRRNSPCGFPRSHSTGDVPAEYSNLRRGGSHHTRRIGIPIRSFPTCVQSAGSACIAMDL
jgi:hypothetical protein